MGLEGKALAFAEYGDPVVADCARNDDHIPRTSIRRGDVAPFGYDAQTRGGDEELVSATLFHHLGIPRDYLHLCLIGGDSHGGDNLAQGIKGQAFLDHEASR